MRQFPIIQEFPLLAHWLLYLKRVTLNSTTAFSFALIGLLFVPQVKNDDRFLTIACVMLFMSLWIDKGLGLVLGGFVPNMLEGVTEYYPTFGEIMITLAVWATGFFVITILYKIAISVKLEKEIS